MESVLNIFFQKLEQIKNADQAILFLKSTQNGKTKRSIGNINGSLDFLWITLDKFEDVQERIEINPSLPVIGLNEQNQSNN